MKEVGELKLVGRMLPRRAGEGPRTPEGTPDGPPKGPRRPPKVPQGAQEEAKMRPRRRHVAIDDGRERGNSEKPKTCKNLGKTIVFEGSEVVGKGQVGPEMGQDEVKLGEDGLKKRT